jgi:DNA-binding FadR family transcriptional regulator
VEDIRKASLDVQLYLFQRHGVYNTVLAEGMISLCACIEIRAAEAAASSGQHLAHARKLEACAADIDYHAYLISTAGNPVFEAVLRSMKPLFAWLYRKIDDFQAQELNWHRERVNQAVREGNSLLAVRSMGLFYETLTSYITGPTKNKENVQGECES